MYESTPLGSLVDMEEGKRLTMLEIFYGLPEPIRKVMRSGNTGAYIRGLMKSMKLPVRQAPEVAFLVLKVAIGEIPLNELSKNIMKSLGTDKQRAQAMALDIERELFTPIIGEFSQYLAKKSQISKQEDDLALGASNEMPNTLNLKK